MKTEISGFRRHYALLLLFLVYAVSLIDRQIMGVLIEPIKHEFHVSDTAMGLLTGIAFALAYSSLAIPFGRYADRANRRNLVGWCCGFWSVMTVVCGFVTNYWQLAIARMGVAVGEAGTGAASLSMIADLYPPQQRARAMSVYSLGAPVGVLVGLSVGAHIAYFYGWRDALIWMAAPGFVIALLVRFSTVNPVRGAWDSSREQVDYARASLRTVLSEVWRSPALMRVMVAGMLLGFTGAASGTWSTAFLMRSQGLSLKDAGALMGLASGPGAVVGSLLSGWLCDRLSRRDIRWQLGVPSIGALLAFPAAIGYLFYPAGHPWMLGTLAIPGVAVFVFAVSVFGVSWIAPSYAALSHLVPADRRTTVLALYNFAVAAIGGGGGPLFVGALSDRLTPMLGSGALRWSLTIAVVGYALGGMLLYLALPHYGRCTAGDATNKAREPALAPQPEVSK